jgi:ferredoxin-NADP reductase
LAKGGRRFQLQCANRDRDAAIFGDALDDLVASHADRFTLAHRFDVDDGFVDVAPPTADFMSGSSAAEAFLYGPTPFMDTVLDAFRSSGSPCEWVHVERFTPVQGRPSAAANDIHVVITRTCGVV